MSIYSDYKCGALSDAEFRDECIRENRRDRYEREYIDDFERMFYESEDENDVESGDD